MLVGIRPQHIRVANGGAAGPVHDARVEAFEALGATGVLIAETGGVALTVLTSPEEDFEPGQPVKLELDVDQFLYFDAARGRNLHERLSMAQVNLINLNKIYPTRDQAVHAVKDLNLTVEDGEFVALLGPSGCGKTSTLRMIVGLETITSGTIAFDGQAGQRPDAGTAQCGDGFRDLCALSEFHGGGESRLFRWRCAAATRPSGDREVARIARLLRIESILDQKPAQLSGGQQQRVSLGRALIRDPAAFILDEVMSHLDAHLKFQMLFELRRIHRSLGKTTIYVTHDQVEALALANRIAVMSNAVLQQYGTRDDLYHRPKNRFVADFIGEPPTNFFTAEIAEDTDGLVLKVDGSGLAFHPDGSRVAALRQRTKGQVTVGIRPQNLLTGFRARHAVRDRPRRPQRISGRAIDRHAGGRRHILSGSRRTRSQAFDRCADILVLPQQRCHGFRPGVRAIYRVEAAGRTTTTEPYPSVPTIREEHHMGIFSGLSRRKFMQYAAAGAGGSVANGMFSRRSGCGLQDIILPPGGKKFADVQLTYFQDSNWLHAPLWLSPMFQKDAGVSIKSRELYEGGDTMAKVLPQLLSKNPRFDWVQYPCLFLRRLCRDRPARAARRLSRAVRKRAGLSGMGDAGLQRVLHQVERQNLRRDARRRHPRSALSQVALRQSGSAEEVLGPLPTGTAAAKDLAGVSGLHPVLHRGAVEPGDLRHVHGGQSAKFRLGLLDGYRRRQWRELFRREHEPDDQHAAGGRSAGDVQGRSSISGLRARSRWISHRRSNAGSRVRMSCRSGGSTSPSSPCSSRGWSVPRIRARISCLAGSSRTAASSIGRSRCGAARRRSRRTCRRTSRTQPSTYIYRMSHPSVSDYIVADAYCGSDPFGASHYTDEAAKHYLEPNPQRGTDNQLWPTNNGIFKNFRHGPQSSRRRLEERARSAIRSSTGKARPNMPMRSVAISPRPSPAHCSPKQALDEAAEEWVKIVQKLGIDKQKAQYANFLDGATEARLQDLIGGGESRHICNSHIRRRATKSVA